jgi:hypothetical protein
MQVCMADRTRAGWIPLPLSGNDAPLLPFWVGSGKLGIPCERMHWASFKSALIIRCSWAGVSCPPAGSSFWQVVLAER